MVLNLFLSEKVYDYVIPVEKSAITKYSKRPDNYPLRRGQSKTTQLYSRTQQCPEQCDAVTDDLPDGTHQFITTVLE